MKKKVYITEKYVDYKTAVALEELEIKKYVSKQIAMPRYNRSGCIWSPTTLEIPSDGYDILCPPISLVREFLAEVYGVEIFVNPVFGEKRGYDSYEVLGYSPEVQWRDEYGLFYLTNEDFNKMRMAEVEGDFHGEFWKAQMNQLSGTYEDALYDGVVSAVQAVTREDLYQKWIALFEKRKADYLASLKEPTEWPEYVYFESNYSDIHSVLKFDSVVATSDSTKGRYIGIYNSKFWVELEWSLGAWRVVDAQNNVYLGGVAHPVGNPAVIADFIDEKDEKRR